MSKQKKEASQTQELKKFYSSCEVIAKSGAKEADFELPNLYEKAVRLIDELQDEGFYIPQAKRLFNNVHFLEHNSKLKVSWAKASIGKASHLLSLANQVSSPKKPHCNVGVGKRKDKKK